MRQIPANVRKQLADDPLMKRCLMCDSQEVEWDHVFTGIGLKQINEWWSIAPLCVPHHRGKLRTKRVQEYAQWWCLMRAGSEPYKKYPKTNWEQIKKYLTNKFV